MVDNTNPKQVQKLPGLVGQYVRTRREALKLSQRALGQLFQPPVTTQFISNVERGVTPLPPAHIPTLAQALKVSESEILKILEKEYTLKLSGKTAADLSNGQPESLETDFFNKLMNAYKNSDLSTQNAFNEACERILKVSNSSKIK